MPLRSGHGCTSHTTTCHLGQIMVVQVQARSQPARWGGSELGWVEHQAHPPPLDIVRVTSVINLKNAPTLGHSQHPPLDIARVTSSTYSKGGTKLLKGGTIAKGWNKIAEGWNKIAKGWNKIAERWNKIAKGWNKIFGMGNWGGGSYDPPDPPWLRA